MRFELFIGLRYLLAKRRQTFISIITFISVAGVAVGVMALIVVLAVMSGFERELRTRILGTNSHFLVLALGGGMLDYQSVISRVMRFPGVVAASPFVTSQVMLTSSIGAQGIVLRGIEPRSASQVTDLASKMKEGRLQALSGAASPGVPAPIILGKELSRNLGVFLGDTVRVVSAAGHLTPLGLVPRSRLFRVEGIFESGLYDYDNTLSYISLDEAQKFMDTGGAVSGIEVKVTDIYRAGEIAAKVQEGMGYQYVTRDWMQMNRNLFSALRLEKITMFVILALIVLVAAFNIVSTLIMIVMEKTREIAVLKSMGARNRSIMSIFILEGSIIGLTGTILGTVGGLALAFSLEQVVAFIEDLFNFKVLSAGVYFIDRLPVQVNYSDVVLIALSAVLLSFAATIYPSWQAARTIPAEALRYE